jgi:DNA repair exonuclease SbcCD ATPase subunit
MKKADELEMIWNRMDAERKRLEKDLQMLEERRGQLEEELTYHNAASEVLGNLSIFLQEHAQKNLSTLCTKALKAVFGVDYDCRLEFVRKRNQVECYLQLISPTTGSILDPEDQVGGGVIDLLSFAVRMACWSMSSPKPEPFFVLDEPFRQVSESNIERAGEFLRRISDQLGVSILLITHSDRLAQVADTVYLIEKRDGKSIVHRI